MICPKAKSATHCLTELFSIYQNKHGTIRRRDHHIVVQSSHRNIFKIDWFQAAPDQLTIPLNKLTYSNPQNELPAQTIITNQPLSVQTISSTLQLEAKSTVEALIHQPTHTQYEFSRFFFLTNISNIMCILASVWLGNFFCLEISMKWNSWG